MKLKYCEGPLLCGCGQEAIGEDDLYTGDLPQPQPAGYMAGLDCHMSDSPIHADPHFYPATALCSECLALKVPPVAGPWYETTVGGQS